MLPLHHSAVNWTQTAASAQFIVVAERIAALHDVHGNLANARRRNNSNE